MRRIKNAYTWKRTENQEDNNEVKRAEPQSSFHHHLTRGVRSVVVFLVRDTVYGYILFQDDVFYAVIFLARAPSSVIRVFCEIWWVSTVSVCLSRPFSLCLLSCKFGFPDLGRHWMSVESGHNEIMCTTMELASGHGHCVSGPVGVQSCLKNAGCCRTDHCSMPSIPALDETHPEDLSTHSCDNISFCSLNKFPLILIWMYWNICNLWGSISIQTPPILADVKCEQTLNGLCATTQNK